jgi:hypothetical protein
MNSKKCGVTFDHDVVYYHFTKLLSSFNKLKKYWVCVYVMFLATTSFNIVYKHRPSD